MSEPGSQNVQSENFDEGGEYEDYGYMHEDNYTYSAYDGEECEEEEAFSMLGDSSDDPEQRRRYFEYLGLIKDIECQNKVVEEIKSQINELCAKTCKTKCEIKNIRRLRECMEQEVIKLRCLMTKAMELQNFGSRRRWHYLPIATTIDEDNMTSYVGPAPQQAQSKPWKSGDSSETDPCMPCAKPKEKEPEDKDKALRCLCKMLCKMKVTCPEDKKALKDITAILCPKKKEPCPPSPPPCSPPPCDPCSSPPPSPCGKRRKSKPCPQPCAMESSGSSDDSLQRLKQKITNMQSSVCQLKNEIYRRSREKDPECEEPMPCEEPSPCDEPSTDPVQQALASRSTKKDELCKLKENYIHLLSEFSKKDNQLKEMEKRLKGFVGGCGADDPNATGEGRCGSDHSELLLLRQRVADMKEEQVEFKCLMKEQSQQLEDYRNKYLIAQQKVEEQAVTLEKLNMNNKRIERQINTEVKEIRAKFQEKLNELLHFPKLLENEQLKLAQACKEKQELQGKLVLVCKELKSLKAQLDNPRDNNDCRPQLAKCQLELEQLKNATEELIRQRDLFCEQLKATQDDLDTLRSESAKIIARTKERAESTKCQMQEQIDRLEKELAQCRATAVLSVSDREAVIREMQGQLNTLSYSFDAAQKQIKTLRNHVAYVSNENTYACK